MNVGLQPTTIFIYETMKQSIGQKKKRQLSKAQGGILLVFQSKTQRYFIYNEIKEILRFENLEPEIIILLL